MGQDGGGSFIVWRTFKLGTSLVLLFLLQAPVVSYTLNELSDIVYKKTELENGAKEFDEIGTYLYWYEYLPL